MKYFWIILLSLLGFSSCAQKPQSNAKLKISMGNITSANSGGVFIKLVDSKDGSENIVKLEADSSFKVNQGSYQLFVFAFEGPDEKSGDMYCGKLPQTDFKSALVSLDVQTTMANCILAEYEKSILELKDGAKSAFDYDRFGLSYWGE